MTYGTIHSTTRDYLTVRAIQSGLDTAKLGLDPSDENIDETVGCTFEISVVYGGALDEEFTVVTEYEVNIADWIAEQCESEAIFNLDDLEYRDEWSVEVYAAERFEGDSPVYSVDSLNFEGRGIQTGVAGS